METDVILPDKIHIMSTSNPFEPLIALSDSSLPEATESLDEEVVIEGLDLIDNEIEGEEDVIQAGDESSEEDDFDYDTDEIDEVFESQLLSAQQQWEESLEQLNKVLNWVLLPLIGKFMGRRMAKVLWQHAMEYLWQ